MSAFDPGLTVNWFRLYNKIEVEILLSKLFRTPQAKHTCAKILDKTKMYKCILTRHVGLTVEC